MAINPGTAFPGKIDNTDPGNYPFGKARNITTPNDGTGTPWVANLLNDLFGFQQAILDEVGVAPSGTPETIVASQYLANLKLIAKVLTKQKPVIFAGTLGNFDSANHLEFISCTNANPITATLDLPVANYDGTYGDTITFRRAPGADDITFTPGAGVSALVIKSGSTPDLTIENQVATVVSLDATTWMVIK